MTSTTDVRAAPRALPPKRRAPLRIHLLGRSAVTMLTSLVGAVLFSLWITAVAMSPVAVFALLVLPVTALVRGYTDVHRRDARRLTGWRMGRAYRSPDDGTAIKRVWAIERDPQSWRDAWWCLLHSIVACTTASLTLSLFASGVFYLSYPFLYWVTPQNVFGHPFGGLVQLHSVAQAAWLMPLALVGFGLWYVLCLPLARLELSLTRALLGAGESRSAT